MIDPAWTILYRHQSSGGDTPFKVNRVGGDYPERTRGKQISLELGFEGDIPTQSNGYIVRYNSARTLLEYAGTAKWGVDLFGKPWVRERVPSDAPVDSHIIKLEPDEVNVPGLWCLVIGGEDLTTVPGSNAIRFDVVVLAQASTYADRAALEADLTPSV